MKIIIVDLKIYEELAVKLKYKNNSINQNNETIPTYRP